MKNSLVTLILFAIATTASAAERLRIGHDAWIGYAAAIVARDKGLLRKEGLDVRTVSFPGPGDTLAPLIAGHLDVAFTTLFNLALLSAKGNDDLVAIYLLDTSNGADAVVAAKGIDSTARLKKIPILVQPFRKNNRFEMAGLI